MPERPRFASSFRTVGSTRTVAAVGALLAATGLVLLFMGRTPICRCGYVSLWHADVVSAGNSQHVADWYTFSHVIHGLGFYGVLSLMSGRLPIGVRLILAVVLEGGWEILVAASRLPVWTSVAAAVTMELVVGYLIRDNLTLNVLMLVYPVEAIRQWQMGA